MCPKATLKFYVLIPSFILSIYMLLVTIKEQNNCLLQLAQVIQMHESWFACKPNYLHSVYKDFQVGPKSVGMIFVMTN